MEQEKTNSMQWTMPSNRGWECFSCSHKYDSDSGNPVCNITIGGSFWKRGCKKTKYELTEDFNLILHQVILDIAALETLKKYLIQWLDAGVFFSIELCSTEQKGQSLYFELETKEEVICSLQKPICKISYNTGLSLDFICAFTIDQSCARICIDELEQFITYNKK